jgi:branched-subunit amino acid ABC-type transport system permease component
MVGTFLGAIAGGLAGAAIAYHDVHKPNCGDLCGLDWLAVPYLAGGGAAAGFVTGGVLAATHHESYWVGVRLPAR